RCAEFQIRRPSVARPRRSVACATVGSLFPVNRQSRGATAQRRVFRETLASGDKPIKRVGGLTDSGPRYQNKQHSTPSLAFQRNRQAGSAPSDRGEITYPRNTSAATKRAAGSATLVIR